MHIMAHTGRSDEHSVGNDGADKLANLAIGIEDGCPYAQKEPRQVARINLSVPYAEKDEAKGLGAKWDPSAKKWYTLKNNPNASELLEKWSIT